MFRIPLNDARLERLGTSLKRLVHQLDTKHEVLLKCRVDAA